MAATLLALAWGQCYASGSPGYDRPGLGFTPAVLQPGDVIWEQGLSDWSYADGASLYTADTQLRPGVGGPFELQLGTSYNRLSGTSKAAWGRGDSSLGLKFALPASGPFSWAFLGSATFTDGAREFRGENRQYLLGAVFNWELSRRNELGAYLQTVRSGGLEDNLVAFNAGHALNEWLGVYVEATWQHTADIGNGSMAGAGVGLWVGDWTKLRGLQVRRVQRRYAAGLLHVFRGLFIEDIDDVVDGHDCLHPTFVIHDRHGKESMLAEELTDELLIGIVAHRDRVRLHQSTVNSGRSRMNRGFINPPATPSEYAMRAVFASSRIVEQLEQRFAFLFGSRLHEIGGVIEWQKSHPRQAFARRPIEKHRDLVRRARLEESIRGSSMKGWKSR